MAKFKITAESADYTREIGGIHFVNGVADTDNEHAARWLEGRGFTVECDEAPKQKGVSQMNQAELDIYAKELGIEFQDGLKVPEKKGIILQHLEALKQE